MPVVTSRTAAVSILLIVAAWTAGCGQSASSAAPEANDAAATTTTPPTLADLLASSEVGAEQLLHFVLRADDLTEVADSFRVWRDAAVDYEAYADVDPILLSPSRSRRAADAGHVAHLVGRDGLTIVHAITATELHQDVRTATRAFRSNVDSFSDGCVALNVRETALPEIGDEATLVTATRTCDFGDPASFGAVVVRYGSLVTTSVVQRGDREAVDDVVAIVADDHAAAIVAAIGGDDRTPQTETSTFGLCIPDPEDPIGSGLDENWRELNTDLIRTFTQRGSTADRDRQGIHRAVLDTLAQANAVLGTSYGGPIDVYFYESIGQLQQAAPHTANEVLGFAFGQQVHQLCGGTLDGTQWVNMAMSAHEYTHIITLNLWGRTSSQVLIEGLAHYATVGERDSIAANYRIEPLVLLSTITDDDGRYGRAWGALLTGYLIEERGGIEAYRDLWFAARTADLAASVEAIYGLTLDELDEAVRASAELKPAP